MPDRHAVGFAHSDPALCQTAEQPPLPRRRRYGFGLGYLPKIGGSDGQPGIAEPNEAQADDDVLAPFERQLGGHFEVERRRSAAQFGGSKITPGQLNATPRRQAE